jgi:membrane-associated protease RseP (regulator of RpoE activity)
VLEGSAAEKCGMKVGDLILSVEGEKVVDPGDLIDLVGEHEGQTVDIDIVRDKRPMRLKAALPKVDETEEQPTGPRASLWRVPAFAPPAPPAPPAHLAVPAPPALPACPAPPARPRVATLFV